LLSKCPCFAIERPLASKWIVIAIEGPMPSKGLCNQCAPAFGVEGPFPWSQLSTYNVYQTTPLQHPPAYCIESLVMQHPPTQPYQDDSSDC
jgi:hypothetical protein